MCQIFFLLTDEHKYFLFVMFPIDDNTMFH